MPRKCLLIVVHWFGFDHIQVVLCRVNERERYENTQTLYFHSTLSTMALTCDPDLIFTKKKRDYCSWERRCSQERQTSNWIAFWRWRCFLFAHWTLENREQQYPDTPWTQGLTIDSERRRCIRRRWRRPWSDSPSSCRWRSRTREWSQCWCCTDCAPRRWWSGQDPGTSVLGKRDWNRWRMFQRNRSPNQAPQDANLSGFASFAQQKGMVGKHVHSGLWCLHISVAIRNLSPKKAESVYIYLWTRTLAFPRNSGVPRPKSCGDIVGHTGLTGEVLHCCTIVKGAAWFAEMPPSASRNRVVYDCEGAVVETARTGALKDWKTNRRERLSPCLFRERLEQTSEMESLIHSVVDDGVVSNLVLHASSIVYCDKSRHSAGIKSYGSCTGAHVSVHFEQWA